MNAKPRLPGKGRRGEFLLQNCKLLQIGILRLVECLMAQYMNCFLQLMELFVGTGTPKRKNFGFIQTIIVFGLV